MLRDLIALAGQRQQRHTRLYYRARVKIDWVPRHRAQKSEFRGDGRSRRHHGRPDERPGEVEDGIAIALAHDGSVLIDAVVNREELAMPVTSRWRRASPS
jgi:hypothetical protein